MSEYREELRLASHDQLCAWIVNMENDIDTKFDLIMENGQRIATLEAQLVELKKIVAPHSAQESES